MEEYPYFTRLNKVVCRSEDALASLGRKAAEVGEQMRQDLPRMLIMDMLNDWIGKGHTPTLRVLSIEVGGDPGDPQRITASIEVRTEDDPENIREDFTTVCHRIWSACGAVNLNLKTPFSMGQTIMFGKADYDHWKIHGGKFMSWRKTGEGERYIGPSKPEWLEFVYDVKAMLVTAVAKIDPEEIRSYRGIPIEADKEMMNGGTRRATSDTAIRFIRDVVGLNKVIALKLVQADSGHQIYALSVPAGETKPMYIQDPPVHFDVRDEDQPPIVLVPGHVVEVANDGSKYKKCQGVVTDAEPRMANPKGGNISPWDKIQVNVAWGPAEKLAWIERGRLTKVTNTEDVQNTRDRVQRQDKATKALADPRYKDTPPVGQPVKIVTDGKLYSGKKGIIDDPVATNWGSPIPPGERFKLPVRILSGDGGWIPSERVHAIHGPKADEIRRRLGTGLPKPAAEPASQEKAAPDLAPLLAAMDTGDDQALCSYRIPEFNPGILSKRPEKPTHLIVDRDGDPHPEMEGVVAEWKRDSARWRDEMISAYRRSLGRNPWPICTSSVAKQQVGVPITAVVAGRHKGDPMQGKLAMIALVCLPCARAHRKIVRDLKAESAGV